MPGESTHRSVPADKHPEQGAEETGLPGPGRTSGVGWMEMEMEMEDEVIKQEEEIREQDIIEDRG